MADPDVSLMIQDVAYAGLDALRASFPLDLCAYLHAAEGAGPQLYLRAPDLSSLDANQAFELFGALRDTLDAGYDHDVPVDVGGFEGVAISTRGSRSRGLYVVGRRTPPLTANEQLIAGRLCRALGTVGHAVEAAVPADAAESAASPYEPVAAEQPEEAFRHESVPVRLSVEVGDGEARAEAAVPFRGEVRTGTGEGPSPVRAVALAVIDAIEPGCKLVHADDGEVGGEEVVLVVVREGERQAVGAALPQGDTLQAVADATRDAVSRLLHR